MEVTECWAQFQATGDPRRYLEYVNAKKAEQKTEE